MSATPAAPSGASTGTPARRPGVVLAVILVTQLMVILDGTVVNIAMPHIQQALHFSRSEEHTSELQSRRDLVCRLLLEKKKQMKNIYSVSDTSNRLPELVI